MTTTENNSKPMLVYTCGEPAGVGVDLAIDLAYHAKRHEVVVMGCRRVLVERALALGRTIECRDYSFDPSSAADELQPGQLWLIDRPCPLPPTPGHPLTENVSWVLENLTEAYRGIRQGRFAGLVTGPIDKSVVMKVDSQFTGHTGYLAQIDGDCHVVMLLASDKIKVALATIHTSLARVSETLIGRIADGQFERMVRVLADGLRRRYAIARPRITLCGLNPHAGEGGLLGTEERDYLAPTLDLLRADSSFEAEIVGPVSADTAFVPSRLTHTDAYLAMYHDQGLPVIKALAFGKIVNVTLGLSIVRTSVDHGVAYDRTGKGNADSTSLMLALNEAQRMCKIEKNFAS